jgi:hypothetical protein
MGQLDRRLTEILQAESQLLASKKEVEETLDLTSASWTVAKNAFDERNLQIDMSKNRLIFEVNPR